MLFLPLDETDATIFVDVKACLETYSRDIIRIKLPEPTQATIFVDLVSFTPGIPEIPPESPKPAPPPIQFNKTIYTQRAQIPGIQMPAPPQGSSHTPVSNVPPLPPWLNASDGGNGPLPLAHQVPPAPLDRRKRKYSSVDYRNGMDDSNTKQKIVFEIHTADVHDTTKQPGSNA